MFWYKDEAGLPCYERYFMERGGRGRAEIGPNVMRKMKARMSGEPGGRKKVIVRLSTSHREVW